MGESMSCERHDAPDLNLLAVCGLYCGACYHYRAGQPGGEHLLADEACGGRPLEGYVCEGCRSGRLYAHANCATCTLRRCAEVRGVLHCGECEDLPCEKLLRFQNDGHKHHVGVVSTLRSIADKGAEVWVRAQARRWSCPSCGAPFSWYEARCHRCGAALPSHGVDEPVRGNAAA
jgi:predicted RNA-binding Zn-ribbon protein involved in translation (DUF1610 family)